MRRITNNQLVGYVSRTQQSIREQLMGVAAVALLVRTAQEMGRDDVPHLAAGVAYYTLLAIFPLALGIIALGSFFVDEATIREQLSGFLQTNLPTSTDLLEQNLDSIQRYRGPAGLLALAGLFWTASNMFGAISRSINRAWNVKEARPFYVEKARQLGMALAAGLLLLLSVGITTTRVILQRIESALDQVPFLTSVGFDLGTLVLSFLVTLVVFALLYKYASSIQVSWRFVVPGALLGAALFELGKIGFIFYLNQFANYQQIYGSLASIIILLVWMYLSALILLLGAEFTQQYYQARQSASDAEPASSSQD